jgi:hypothetical protein
MALPRHYARCQPLGAAWYQRQTAAVLRVPSSIIAHEHNYVLNTRHPDFAQIRIVAGKISRSTHGLKAKTFKRILARVWPGASLAPIRWSAGPSHQKLTRSGGLTSWVASCC